MAERYIESLYEREDPFVQALMDVPEMDEPLSGGTARCLTRTAEPSKPAI